MSKLTEVKYRIIQLDGGSFQNLCDAYLYCRGYGSGYSLGMKTGTNKTIKGNPDTYFLNADGKYVFVMYTVQQTDFIKKAMEDIDKCLDLQKTGLAADQVAEIILCYTYGRLSAGEHLTLRKYCSNRNVLLTMIGLDELGNDICFKYPQIARDYLGIRIDSGQIMTMDNFLKNHDANKLSAPLNIPFMFRNKELQEAEERLNKNDILILSGPAGTGKTRLALKICNEYAEKNKHDVLCVKSNTLEIYDDLVTTIEKDKSYTVFIDDANELTGLHFFLESLVHSKGKTSGIKKIVISVRDYARQKVLNSVLEYEKPSILKIGFLKDEEIKQLVSKAMGIKNHLYLERIVEIAAGNARLAVLAAKVAVEKNQLDSIRDASELYEHYYGEQIKTILLGETGIRSAGLIAFFQALRLDHLEHLESAFELMGITKDQFADDMKHLHNLELVDMSHDIAVKISDQSFSNYLVKYVFIDDKIIPLHQMVETCFFINRQATINACNTLINVFASKTVHEYLNEQLCIVWDALQTDEKSFLPFFEAFHMIRPTETLIIIRNWINAESPHSLNVGDISFDKKGNTAYIDDRIIKILCSFDDGHEDLSTAIDLLLLYYQKRPDLFSQIYSAFVTELSINSHSHHYGYYTQKTAIDRICAALDEASSSNLKLLFIRVAEWYLKLIYTSAESGRGRSALIYTIPLMGCKPLFDYRKRIIDHLFDLYKNGEYHTEIESLLMDYCRDRSIKTDNSILRNEYSDILQFFSCMSSLSLYHCLIADHIRDIGRRIKCNYGKELAPFLRSRAYKLFRMLHFDKREWIDLDYHAAHLEHHKLICDKTRNYALKDYQFLFTLCSQYIKTIDYNAVNLTDGVNIVIESAFIHNKIYAEVIEAYMAENTPYSSRSDTILEKLFQIMKPIDIRNMIISHNFDQKNQWQWSFYAELPEEHITAQWANDLLSFLSHPQVSITTSSSRSIEQIAKYNIIDQNFMLKAINTITEHYEESPFIFHLYFDLMMLDSCKGMPWLLTEKVDLLEEIYLKEVKYSVHSDYNGCLLSAIIDRDLSFLSQYIQSIPSGKNNYRQNREPWINRLLMLWKKENYIFCIDTVSEYYFQKQHNVYNTVVGQLLYGQEQSVYERQELWIKRQIELHSADSERMYVLFDALSVHTAERRRNALKILVSKNYSFDLFKNIPLESSSWDVTVSSMNDRINYLKTLLPLFSGLKYLDHKTRIEQDIRIWEERIKNEEISELLETI